MANKVENGKADIKVETVKADIKVEKVEMDINDNVRFKPEVGKVVKIDTIRELNGDGKVENRTMVTVRYVTTQKTYNIEDLEIVS